MQEIENKDLLFIITEHNKQDDFLVCYEMIKHNLFPGANIFMVSNAEKEKRKSWDPFLLNNMHFLEKNEGWKKGSIQIIKESLLLNRKRKEQFIIVINADLIIINKNIIYNIIDKMIRNEKDIFYVRKKKENYNEFFRTCFLIFKNKQETFKKISKINYNLKGKNEYLLTEFIKNNFQQYLEYQYFKMFTLFEELKFDNKDKNNCIIHTHIPKEKKIILQSFDITRGKNIQKLLNSTDLSYFNGGVEKQR